MKTRYKILTFNVLLSVLYYFFLLLYLSKSKIFESGVVGFFTVVSDTISLILYYNWINAVWVILFLFGLIKKKKEFIIGGVLSVILSILLFLSFIFYFHI